MINAECQRQHATTIPLTPTTTCNSSMIHHQQHQIQPHSIVVNSLPAVVTSSTTTTSLLPSIHSHAAPLGPSINCIRHDYETPTNFVTARSSSEHIQQDLSHIEMGTIDILPTISESTGNLNRTTDMFNYPYYHHSTNGEVIGMTSTPSKTLSTVFPLTGGKPPTSQIVTATTSAVADSSCYATVEEFERSNASSSTFYLPSPSTNRCLQSPYTDYRNNQQTQHGGLRIISTSAPAVASPPLFVNASDIDAATTTTMTNDEEQCQQRSFLVQNEAQQQHLSLLLAQQRYSLPPAALHLPVPSSVESILSQQQKQPQQQFYMPTEGLHQTSEPSSVTTVSSAAVGTPSGTTSKALVLDRINICISNHYLDALPILGGNATSTQSSSLSTSSAIAAGTNNVFVAGNAISSTTMVSSGNGVSSEQPPSPMLNSPIIPAIQHKSAPTANEMMLSTEILSSSTLLASTSQSEGQASKVCIDDEPDSTTATPPQPLQQPQSTLEGTPPRPATPVTPLSPTVSPRNKTSRSTVEEDAPSSSLSLSSSPTTTTMASTTTLLMMYNNHDNVPTPQNQQIARNSIIKEESVSCRALQSPASAQPGYENGEDVLIKRIDGCFYLGTVIDSCQTVDVEKNYGKKFLVRFDDHSEQWCTPREMRKLGGGYSNVTTTTDESLNVVIPQPRQMCLVCKGKQPMEVVEICERCGRGYHQRCTRETMAGSGNWICKRCDKPMKIATSENEENDDQTQETAECGVPQYYAAPPITKCFCGIFREKSDKSNSVQCCKCRFWFHMRCLPQISVMPLRGDNFFIFCCSSCHGSNDDQGMKQRRRYGCTSKMLSPPGDSFVCRLQMSWTDVLQLALYNLAPQTSPTSTELRFYHLTKDILPFLLEHRQALAIPKEWLMHMSELMWLDNLRRILCKHNDRFIVCTEKSRRDHQSLFALRRNEPPMMPDLPTSLNNSAIKLNRHFLQKECGLNLLELPSHIAGQAARDVYEFRLEDDDTSDNDEDEIPIKKVIESSVRNSGGNESLNLGKGKTSPLTILPSLHKNNVKGNSEIIDREEDNIDVVIELPVSVPSQAGGQQPVLKNSRKRKSYRPESLSDNNNKHAFANISSQQKRNCCDSSSDENSSSSRGTSSLDWIIPPPKDFLGLNNPFRMITPKKQQQIVEHGISSNNGCRPIVVNNSIFTSTSALNFSTKLAALKKAGIFPHDMSTSELLAKAAGQPRTVRTIKRRLSAKDITIGPNQEVRRRRTRRFSTNVEVISTTTINPIPNSLFSTHAKDLFSLNTSFKYHQNYNHQQQKYQATSKHALPKSGAPLPPSFSPPEATTSIFDNVVNSSKGRRLRQRLPPPPSSFSATTTTGVHNNNNNRRQTSPAISNTRRNSVSSVCSATHSSNSNASAASSSSTNLSSSNSAAVVVETENNSVIMRDLKESVHKYFGAVNRIESGEQFTICAQRRLPQGQTQYLIEWADPDYTIQGSVTKEVA